MKFKLYPSQTFELELFENTKDKTKRVWVWVTWSRIDRTELDSADYDWAEGCENEEQLQDAFNKVISTATPADEDSKDVHQKEFKNLNKITDEEKKDGWEDLPGGETINIYNISEIERVTGIDGDSLINSSSGGGANSQVWSWENVTEEEKQQKIKNDDEWFDDDEYITLEQAAENYRDEAMEKFGYSMWGTETYYEMPIRVEVDQQQLEKDNANVVYQMDKNDSARKWKSKIDELFTRKNPAKAKLDELTKQLANVKDKDLELVLKFYEKKHGDTEFKGSGMKKIDNTAKINFLKSLK